LRGLSRYRRSRAPRGFAELYGALTLVAITLAVSYVIYSEIHLTPTDEPVYSMQSFSVYGSPSFLHLTVNASAETHISQIQVDSASSSAGILELAPSGYQTTTSLCAEGSTTFFTVLSGAGFLTVSSQGRVWIDGNESSSLNVTSGWHEIVISDSSSCTVTLPDGQEVSYPSDSVSSLPTVQSGPNSFVMIIPFAGDGHSVTTVFDGAIEKYAF
jgi:hypothetical protein